MSAKRKTKPEAKREQQLKILSTATDADVAIASGSQIISFRLDLLSICDNRHVVALILSQLLYLQTRVVAPGEWFYRTRDTWMEELRITKRCYEEARTFLRSKGFLEEERRGLPAKIHYRLDLAAIGAAIRESFSSALKLRAEVCQSDQRGSDLSDHAQSDQQCTVQSDQQCTNWTDQQCTNRTDQQCTDILEKKDRREDERRGEKMGCDSAQPVSAPSGVSRRREDSPGGAAPAGAKDPPGKIEPSTGGSSRRENSKRLRLEQLKRKGAEHSGNLEPGARTDDALQESTLGIRGSGSAPDATRQQLPPNGTHSGPTSGVQNPAAGLLDQSALAPSTRGGLFPNGALQAPRTPPSDPGQFWSPPEPPWPPETPQDVLAAFNYDMSVRHKEAVRPILVWSLNKTQSGQVRTVLGPYSPEQIRDMIRVLVYDWEAICEKWWQRPNTAYPTFDDLFRLHKDLCASIATGVASGVGQRGRHDTYARTFLRKRPEVDDVSMPF